MRAKNTTNSTGRGRPGAQPQFRAADIDFRSKSNGDSCKVKTVRAVPTTSYRCFPCCATTLYMPNALDPPTTCAAQLATRRVSFLGCPLASGSPYVPLFSSTLRLLDSHRVPPSASPQHPPRNSKEHVLSLSQRRRRDAGGQEGLLPRPPRPCRALRRRGPER